MENGGKRLGWIAIGISVVALMIALFKPSHGGMRHMYHYEQRMPGPPAGYYEGPRGENYGPRGEGYGPRGENYGPRGEGYEGYGPRGEGYGPHGGFYERGERRGGWFFGPLMLLGGLFKLALFGLAIFLGLKLLRKGFGWKRPGSPNGGAGHDETRDPPSNPPAPPFTGDTRSL
jgi:hypothetical protein